MVVAKKKKKNYLNTKFKIDQNVILNNLYEFDDQFQDYFQTK